MHTTLNGQRITLKESTSHHAIAPIACNISNCILVLRTRTYICTKAHKRTHTHTHRHKLWVTQGLLELVLVGVFEDEEMVSGGVGGNPVGKLSGLCGVGVYQLNRLPLYIQPLERVQPVTTIHAIL